MERTVAGAGGGESILSGAREVEVLRARVGGAEGRTVAGIGGGRGALDGVQGFFGLGERGEEKEAEHIGF